MKRLAAIALMAGMVEPVASQQTPVFDDAVITSAAQGNEEARELVRAELRRLKTIVMQNVEAGTPHTALPYARQMLDLTKRAEPENQLALAQAKCALAIPLSEAVDFEEAESVLTEFAQHASEVPDDQALVLLDCHLTRATNLDALGRADEAMALLRSLIADPRWDKADARDRSEMSRSLSLMLSEAGRFGEAEPIAREAYAIISAALADNHFAVDAVRINLAQTLIRSGQFEEAIPLIEQTVPNRIEQLGADHPVSLIVQSTLGTAYQEVGRYDEALVIMERVYSAFVEMRGADSFVGLKAAHN